MSQIRIPYSTLSLMYYRIVWLCMSTVLCDHLPYNVVSISGDSTPWVEEKDFDDFEEVFDTETLETGDFLEENRGANIRLWQAGALLLTALICMFFVVTREKAQGRAGKKRTPILRRPELQTEDLETVLTSIRENNQHASRRITYPGSSPNTMLCYKRICFCISEEFIPKIIENTTAKNNGDRVVGSMVGMGIGDGVGAPLEFFPIESAKKHKEGEMPRLKFTKDRGMLYETYHHKKRPDFHLEAGQWTDDASMGLCIADSLIIRKEFDGTDIRNRFGCWWYHGYNNAFRKDRTRNEGRTSIGLGGNISKSLKQLTPDEDPSPRYETKEYKDDSGNGALMRLAPIVLRYHSELADDVRNMAFRSSLTTHSGLTSGESCAFWAYVIWRALNIPETEASQNIQVWLRTVVKDYRTILEKEIKKLENFEDVAPATDSPLNSFDKYKPGFDSEWQATVSKTGAEDVMPSAPDQAIRRAIRRQRKAAKTLIIKLIDSKEAAKDKEYCWNWQLEPEAYKDALVQTYTNRKGKRGNGKYNGYPVSAGYFGSYCMDGLAMALHGVYHSTSFESAIQRTVNLLGDADTTGSIAGQLAGAFYGYKAIKAGTYSQQMLENLNQWDDHQFALTAAMLHHLAINHPLYADA